MESLNTSTNYVAGLDIIDILRLSIRTEIGISSHEIGKKQDVLIDLRLGCNMRKVGKTDDVKDTLNYRDVSKSIINYAESTSFNMIEKLATDIARICITIHKVR